MVNTLRLWPRLGSPAGSKCHSWELSGFAASPYCISFLLNRCISSVWVMWLYLSLGSLIFMVWDGSAVCLDPGCVWQEVKDSESHVADSIRGTSAFSVTAYLLLFPLVLSQPQAPQHTPQPTVTTSATENPFFKSPLRWPDHTALLTHLFQSNRSSSGFCPLQPTIPFILWHKSDGPFTGRVIMKYLGCPLQ